MARARFFPMSPHPTIPMRISTVSPLEDVASAVVLDAPSILIDELHGAYDRFADRQLRAPAELADASAVEQDERAVADPATLTASVPTLRRKAQRLGDPADRIVEDRKSVV